MGRKSRRRGGAGNQALTSRQPGNQQPTVTPPAEGELTKAEGELTKAKDELTKVQTTVTAAQARVDAAKPKGILGYLGLTGGYRRLKSRRKSKRKSVRRKKRFV